MVTETGTSCSVSQELFVHRRRNARFRAGDTAGAVIQNRAMTAFMDSEQRGAAAFRRLQELLDDLAYGDDAAMNYVFDIAGKPAEIGEKAIKQWFSRKSIPAYAIFNLAEALGVDVTWLAGSDRISKEKAILRGGPYQRELERVERIRADFASKRARVKA